MTITRRSVAVTLSALVLLLVGCTTGGTVAGTEIDATGPPPSTSASSPSSSPDDPAPESGSSDTSSPDTSAPEPSKPGSSASTTSTVTTVRTVTPLSSTAPSATTPSTTALPTTSVTPSVTGPAVASTASRTSSASNGSARTLCAADTTDDAIAQCLRTELSTFWSGRINDTIEEPVFLDPAEASVPKECRPGLAGPAFTCRSDQSLYITQDLLDTIDDNLPKADLFYALASVQSHEMGHILQYTLHQPEVAKITTNAQSQFVEQQADCLSGVWAHHAEGIDRPHFREVAVELITLVSSNAEIATHGTPAQRAAALDRGLASGRPQSCRLATFG